MLAGAGGGLGGAVAGRGKHAAYSPALQSPAPIMMPMAQSASSVPMRPQMINRAAGPMDKAKSEAPLPPLAMRPPPRAPGGMMRRAPMEASPKNIVDKSTVPAGAYLVQLATLARELDAQAKGRVDVVAIRLLRQRLTEWVEDVRSVGGHDELAAAVDVLAKRLSAALASATHLAAEAAAVATELGKLANGEPPPRKNRVAFWK